MMMRLGVAVVWITLMVGAFSLGRRDSVPEPARVPAGAELQMALDQGRPMDRAADLSRYLEALSPANVEETAQIIERTDRFFTQAEHLWFMTAWIRFDPEGALDWARTREGRLQRHATLAVVEALASVDPEAASRRVEDLDDVSYAGLLRKHLVRGWVRSGQLEALTLHVIGLDRSVDRKAATTTLTKELLKEGVEPLTDWADSISEDAPHGFKGLAFRETVSILAVLDPATAAEWSQDYVEEDYGKGLLEYIARRWAARSWESTFDWLISLPPSEERKKTLQALFAESLTRRPKRAETWARAAAPHDGLDSAIRVLVQRDYWDRPAAAMDWTLLLSDEDVRSEVQVGVGISWYSREPEEFQNWAAENDLDTGILDQIYAVF